MSLRSRLENDVRYCIDGDQQYLDPSEKLRLCDGNLRRSLEAAREETASPINQVLALIGASRIEEARRTLSETPSDPDAAKLADTMKALQTGRILMSEARWDEALAILREELAKDIPGVWRLSAHQMASNCHFELGFPAQALREVEAAIGLVEIYPRSPVVSYLAVVEIRALFAVGRPEDAKAFFERYCVLNPARTPDDLLTLSRLISSMRLARRDATGAARASLASYWIARKMGDRLYAGLGLAEAFAISPSLLNEDQRSELAGLSDEYLRIREFMAIRYQSARDYSRARLSSGADPLARSEPGALYFPELGCVLRLERLRLHQSRELMEDGGMNPKLLRALAGQAEIPKEAFFQAVWGIRFDKLRHKGVLSMALKRLRDKCGIEVRVRNQAVTSDLLYRV